MPWLTCYWLSIHPIELYSNLHPGGGGGGALIYELYGYMYVLL